MKTVISKDRTPIAFDRSKERCAMKNEVLTRDLPEIEVIGALLAMVAAAATLLLLAGLQAMSKDLLEAARVDGATGWQSFRHVNFPLMLPVSITVLVIRIIFKLKLADIVINVTAGGPGGATDTVSSFIYRVYRDRSNVGYGTGLAMFYLVLIIIFLTILLRLSRRWTQRVT